jgi:hypothetical protein
VQKKIEKDYHSVHDDFTSLHSAGLIQEVRMQSMQGGKFPEYWLTYKGALAILAFSEKTNLFHHSDEYLTHEENALLKIFAKELTAQNRILFIPFFSSLFGKNTLLGLEKIVQLIEKFSSELEGFKQRLDDLPSRD